MPELRQNHVFSHPVRLDYARNYAKMAHGVDPEAWGTVAG
jgi:hypothetical protein